MFFCCFFTTLLIQKEQFYEIIVFFLVVFFLEKIICGCSLYLFTPRKINMELENTPLEKEKHLPNHHFQVLCQSYHPWISSFLPRVETDASSQVKRLPSRTPSAQEIVVTWEIHKKMVVRAPWGLEAL